MALFIQDFPNSSPLLQLSISDRKYLSKHYRVRSESKHDSPFPHSHLSCKPWTQGFFTQCSWRHLSPLPPVPSKATGIGLGLCPHVQAAPSLSHLHFWDALSDSPSPPRLQLSALKYQSLPIGVRGDTQAVPERQESAAISSVFGLEFPCQAPR